MTLDEQQAICGAVQHEVYCANHCDWRGLEADLVEDEEGNEPHCPKCGSNWAILDVDLEAFAYTARTEWPKLIEEHRKALAEIERLKTALSDLLQVSHSLNEASKVLAEMKEKRALVPTYEQVQQCAKEEIVKEQHDERPISE